MKNLLAGLLFILAGCRVAAQADSSKLDKLISLPNKLLTSVDKKATEAEQRLNKATNKYLSRLERHEKKLKNKLWKKDPILAKELFPDIKGRYQKLRQTSGDVSKHDQLYSPRLDSLSTTLNFLDNKKLTQNPELQKALSSLKEVQGRLTATDQIRKQLVERQRLLKQKFSELGMLKELRKFRKEVYYYQAQVKEYRAMWEDPKKLERKLLDLALKHPKFKEFFSRNSQLASLFALSGGSSSDPTASLQGLQTRSSFQQGLIQRFGSTAEVTQAVQGSVQAAQEQLSALQAKAQRYSSGNLGSAEDLDMPQGFKPNDQKTKPFLQRIELGANIQTQKARYYFPVTTDLALSAGYKLNNKSILGIGVSYKAGLGRGWNHLALSHEGIGFRSFVDYKLKGSLYISGGYEGNYLSGFNRIEQLRDYSSWQVSGLFGLAKKYKVSKKLKGEIKLLWDFLSYNQTPRTQPVLFRVGYSLK